MSQGFYLATGYSNRGATQNDIFMASFSNSFELCSDLIRQRITTLVANDITGGITSMTMPHPWNSMTVSIGSRVLTTTDVSGLTVPVLAEPLCTTNYLIHES